MNATSRVRHKRIGVAGLAIAFLAVLFPLLASSSPAGADTPGSPYPVAATTPHQTNVAPNGPLTGLVNGDVVTVRVDDASPSNQISGIVAIRQCEGGVVIGNAADMGPSNTGFCTDTPLAPGSDNVRGPATKAVPSDTFVTLTFRVGVGSENVVFDDGSGTQTNNITCDASNPCTLWIQIARPGGNDFRHYDLQFLGQPGAPTGVNATCNATGADVSWTAPALNGNSPIASYTISATPTGGGAAVSPVTVTGNPPATNGSISGFTQFSPYSITVTATNAGGQTGPASAAVTGVQTCVAGPHLNDAVVGDASADLSWTAVAGATGYELVVTPVSPAGPALPTFTPAGTTQHVGGLTNGTLYSAVVRASFGGGNLSGPSNTIQFTPISTLITQTITVRRPAGALVLTQVCTEDGNTTPHAPTILPSGTDPLYPDYPYPQDAVTGDSVANYPTNCGIALAPGKLMTADDPTVPGNEAGQFFQTSGKINQVTVVDTRDVSPNGWTVNGKMANFVNGNVSGSTISGDELGWTPHLTDDSDFVTFSDGTTYDQTVTQGPVVLPNRPAGTGLGGGAVLGSAPVDARLGIAKLDADIRLWIPVTARTGNYTGVLTITAI